MTIDQDQDLKPSRLKFSVLKKMLRVIFPEVSRINKRFLMELTPGGLKHAYMRQAVECHPKTANGLSEQERTARKKLYQRLFQAYNTLLPQVKANQAIRQPEESQFRYDSFGIETSDKTIIAVGGAKGGVGKSVLSANLAVGLALLGQKVVLADLDLGGADVHLYLGVKSLSKTWNDFLEKKVGSIKDILTPTPFEGLTLIGGNSSKLGSANIPFLQKQKIIRHLKALEGNYIIIDLGGDTSYNVLDFFLLADHKIVVTGTEPASILDSYSFVKVAFYRSLERLFAKSKSLKDLRQSIRDGSMEENGDFSMDTLFTEVRARDASAYAKLREQVDQFRLSLVVNMAENRKDVRIAESMQHLLKKKCSLYAGILGTIPFDKLVRKAARSFTPIVVENPQCQASQVIHQMLAAIILLREPESIRAELLQKTSLIRSEAKDRICSGTMMLDGLTIKQINSIFDRSLKLRQSFQKILNIVTA